MPCGHCPLSGRGSPFHSLSMVRCALETPYIDGITASSAITSSLTAPAEPADGVRVRILSGLVRVCAVALLAGCSMIIDTHKGPAPDWPELRIVEHHVSSAAMREVCVRAQPWFAFGMVDACVYWRFATSWSTSGCTARGTTTPARTRRGGRGRPTSRGAVDEQQPPEPRG
jgi:hypothetical protein